MPWSLVRVNPAGGMKGIGSKATTTRRLFTAKFSSSPGAPIRWCANGWGESWSAGPLNSGWSGSDVISRGRRPDKGWGGEVGPRLRLRKRAVRCPGSNPPSHCN